MRSGDLGSLPVVVGLVDHLDYLPEVSIRFSCRSNNLVNLLFDCSTVGVIALGIVCILMVGEIDLSVGSVSGFALGAGRCALGQSGGGRRGRRLLAALVVGGAIGGVYAVLFNRFGMPSFVLDARGPARGSRPAALFPGSDRLDQPAVRLRPGGFRPDAW